MLGKFAGLMCTFFLNSDQDLFEGLVAARIHLDALTGSFFYDSMRKILHGVQEACTGVIGLFLMFGLFSIRSITSDMFGPNTDAQRR